jgi:hypothetical protein
MKLQGYFTIGVRRIKNTLTVQGQQAMLRNLMRGEAFVPFSGTGTFFIGLCGINFDPTFTLASIVGEPAVANNYARQAINRDIPSWTMTVVNNVTIMRGSVLNFTAVGGNYSLSIRRAFLCNVNAGTGGVLFAISGPLQVDTLITPTAPLPVQYELHLRS